MQLTGTYCGIVETVNDPLKLGRIKARVPHVYGASSEQGGSIGTNDLPWALPAGMPAGGRDSSGGISHLPSPGDHVYVRFLDGEPEKPIWEWGMQTMDDAKNVPLHQYATNKDGSVGAPYRSILTRYGHSVELKENVVTVTTSEGYQLLIENSQGETGGSIALQTPAGQRVSLNDTNKGIVLQGLDAVVMSAASVLINAAKSSLVRASESYTAMVGASLITIKNDSMVICSGNGATLTVDPSGNIALTSAGAASVSVEKDKVQMATPDGTGVVLENGKLSITAVQTAFNTQALAIGQDALYAPLLVTPSLLAWILGHTHISSTPGSPTGPPIPLNPLFPMDSASQKVRTT